MYLTDDGKAHYGPAGRHSVTVQAGIRKKPKTVSVGADRTTFTLWVSYEAER